MLKLTARMKKIPNSVRRKGRRNDRSTGTLSPPEGGAQPREPFSHHATQIGHCEACDSPRPEEENEDDDHEGDHRAVRERHAERIVKHADPEVLCESHDEPARNRAPIGNEPAEDRGGEEPEEDPPPRLRRHRPVYGPERAAEACEAAREEPGEAPDLRRADPRDAGEVKVRGHGPGPLSEAGP